MFDCLDELNFRGKRIVFHIGTPKTGTTALQSCLGTNVERLERAGWRYPPSFAARVTREVRHQVLVTDLMKGELDESIPLLHDIQDSGISNIFLSSEGFYTNLPRIEGRLLDFLQRLGTQAEVEVTCVFRPKEDFMRSLYKQFVFAGPWATLPLSGYTGTQSAFQDEAEVRYLLDYDGIIDRFRARGITFNPVFYTSDIITEYERLYFGVELDRSGVFSNTGHSAESYDLFRWCNLTGVVYRDKISLLRLMAGRMLQPDEAGRLAAALDKIAATPHDSVVSSSRDSVVKVLNAAQKRCAEQLQAANSELVQNPPTALDGRGVHKA